MKLTKKEKSILYWFFCGDSMHTDPVLLGQPKTYRICCEGSVYMQNISETTVISLVKKKAIIPLGLSIKEWKVQIALGTDEDTEFELTELGARAGTEHLEWSYDWREERIAERMKQNCKKI